MPELVQDQKDYDSKLDAINDLKEVRETNAPSIYDDALIDSLGFYDPDLPKRKRNGSWTVSMTRAVSHIPQGPMRTLVLRRLSET